MTSPLSSLGKNRRMPLQLQKPGKRAVPFKESVQNGAAPTDMELMTSMMQKIAALEQKLKSQAQEIQHKEKTINKLQGEVKILQKGKEESSGSSREQELEVLCLELQRQIWEMERFLNDYGLIWVGEGTDSLEEQELPEKEGGQPPRAFLVPGTSRTPSSSINFDVLFQNLKDLNVLAGEGVSQIEHTAGGARLKQLDPVPLTFYQNGIVMFNGPFRSYEEPSTQQCLRDLMDGYFPSELQKRYPDGIPFQVTDKRDVFFRERRLPEGFPGLGQVTGRSGPSGMKETSEIPGPKLTVEQFLRKLPRSLIRGGQVINVRGDIGEVLQGSSRPQGHEAIPVEPPRDEAATEKRVKSGRRDTTALRIRSEDGEKTYIVTMPGSGTVGDLRQHLARVRGGESESYDILGLFPHQVYDDNSMTLEGYGLVPNACLLLQKKPPSSLSQGQQL